MKNRLIAAIALSVLFTGCVKNTASQAAVSITKEAAINDDTFNYRDYDIYSTPNSSCFSSIGYNNKAAKLYVCFRKSGSEYLYSDVPESEWNNLKNASSKGSYYNSDIKGQYKCTKLD